MKRKALIINGNVGVPRPSNEAELGSVPIPDHVNHGDTTPDGGATFFRNGVLVVEPTPEEIPLWAFRSSLVLAGITEATVDAMLAELPQPARTVASIQWNYGNFIRRDHPLIDQLGGALGLTAEQINGVFRIAETLV